MAGCELMTAARAHGGGVVTAFSGAPPATLYIPYPRGNRVIPHVGAGTCAWVGHCFIRLEGLSPLHFISLFVPFWLFLAHIVFLFQNI